LFPLLNRQGNNATSPFFLSPLTLIHILSEPAISLSKKRMYFDFLAVGLSFNFQVIQIDIVEIQGDNASPCVCPL